MEEILSRKYRVLKIELNERQRRLWAASEAMGLGHGGITLVSKATGISRPTITLGLKELQNEERLPEGRVRREGGGRKKSAERQPDLIAALDALGEPTAKGDPMSPLRWTTHSTRHLSDALQEQGFDVSHVQVFRLLHEMDYHLSANRKSLEGGTNADRNEQFDFINKQAKTSVARWTAAGFALQWFASRCLACLFRFVVYESIPASNGSGLSRRRGSVEPRCSVLTLQCRH